MSEVSSALFQITEEQAAFQRTIAQFAEEKIAPRAAEIDRAGVYPQENFDLLRENDLLGLPLPVEYSGGGASVLDTCLAVETMATYCYNTAYLMVLTFNPFLCIFHAGREDQKERYLTPLATGEMRAAFALSEPEAGSDAAALSTRAVREQDSYILTGQKTFITNAAVADFLVVFARTGNAGTTRDISAFIVPTDADGLTIGPPEHKIGGRALPSSPIYFDGCRIPASNLLGDEGTGFRTALGGLTRLRPVLAARALGLAQGALNYATAYIQERRQFGHVLAEFQGLRFMVAEMATELEASRGLIYRAAALMDSGDLKEGALLSSMAKLHSAEVAQRIASDSAQLLGANGCSSDYPLERFVRDSRLLTVAGGTSEIQKVQIARSLLPQSS